MRERPIPCRGATLADSRLGTHKTWADDGYCDRCRVLNAQSIVHVRAAQAAPISQSAPGGADRTASPFSSRATSPGFSSPAIPPAATSAPEARTARGARSGTSGDFLSVGRPGEQQLQAPPAAVPALRGSGCCSPPT